MAEDKELPGWPKKRLVREVRAHLRSYGIRPQGQAWRATWEWASAIANSYFHTHWPLPSGLGGKLVLPFSVWLMKRTVLGNPFIRPWDHLAPATADFAMQEFRFGSYYVCRGSKPPAIDPPGGCSSDA